LATKTKKGYEIEFCSHCAEIEKKEKLYTFDKTEWILISGFCRDCKAYEVIVEYSNG